MITGPAQMGSAILVVAATDGLMLQTHKHILLSGQVSVPFIIVCMNKYYMLDYKEFLKFVEIEVRELLSVYNLPSNNWPVICGSALKALEGAAELEAKIIELTEVLDFYI